MYVGVCGGGGGRGLYEPLEALLSQGLPACLPAEGGEGQPADWWFIPVG